MQRLAQQAARQHAVQMLQRQAGLQRIWATCDASNHASAAVLQKAGLQMEGRLRRATLRPNFNPTRPAEPRDTLMYAWVRTAAPEDSA